MKINLKFYYYKRVYNHFCILALLNVFFSTDCLYAKTFSINDIKISAPFEINFDKNEIIDKGFIQGFDQLILSIIKTDSKKKLRKTSLRQIKGLIETFSIEKEKFIDEVYYLNLNVSFNKKKLFRLLESQNIFPSLPIKKDIFFIPIILDENKDEILMISESKIFSKWNSSIKKHHLLEYVLPTDDLEDFNLIKGNSKNLENYDFKEIIQKYNLEDYIVTIIFRNKEEIRVLNKINFNDKLDLKNLVFKNINFDNEKEIEEFINNLKLTFENYWKSKNEINTSVKLPLTISVNNNDSFKVSELETVLSNIDLIYDFNILKFDNKNIFYKIIFNGSPDYFLEIMKDKNLKFDTQNHVWKLK